MCLISELTWTNYNSDPLSNENIRYSNIQGVPGGRDKTSGVFLVLKYTDITQNTYIQS